MSLRGRTVVILTPAWMHGDGVGHDVEGMTRALSGAGCDVHVYAPLGYAPAYASWKVTANQIRPLLDRPDTILIYHHSIGFPELERLLAAAKCRHRILRYHNVTPPEFFEGYNQDWVDNCANGRRATVEVTKLCNAYCVPSLYDARDLVHAGASVDDIYYVPYFHKLDDFDRVTPAPEVLERLESDKRLHVLFVGRRVPNKGHLHLIRAIGAYVRMYDRDIALHLVGASDGSLARYNEEIRAEIEQHGLQANVYLYDKSPFPEIVAYYKGCDVFLCMSEHEGFCIPVIEAEYCGLPVIAHYRRGVPEALGPTQPWLTSLHYEDYAKLLRKIRSDAPYRKMLASAAAASVRERFDINDIKARFLGWIEDLAEDSSIVPITAALRPQNVGKPKAAIVVQRFGHDVAGGAEYFARMCAERLSARYEITVLTTTSKTLDWDSEIVGPAADGNEERYEVMRFRPSRPRDWSVFDEASRRLQAGEISYEKWSAEHGPDVPELADFLDAYGDEFDLVINWTYLYATATYPPVLRGRVKLVNIPCFHDEWLLYLPGTAALAEAYDSYVFQTPEERALACRAIEGIADKPFTFIGPGIEEEISDRVQSAPTTSPVGSPYLLFIGRIEKVKGILELVDFFKRYKAASKTELKLVVIGRAYDCEIEPDEDIILPGFVSDEEKSRYIKHALGLVNPSPLESFSIVLLESWAMARPVLVTGNCAPTSGQVARSGGGMVYNNFREFTWAIQKLESDRELRDLLGANGKKYYEDNYRWGKLIPKLTAFLDEQMGIRHPGNAATG